MGLSITELIIILIIAFLVFGAGKLPEVGSSLGKAIRDFRRATSGHDDDSAEQADESQARDSTSTRDELPAGETALRKSETEQAQETTKA